MAPSRISPAPTSHVESTLQSKSHLNSSAFQDFPDIPPFPSSIPTAPLLRISLSKLQRNDAEESARFFQACKDLGFFYLDLRKSLEGEAVLGVLDELFDVGKRLFELRLEEKQKYDFSGKGSYYGYKGYGTSTIDARGTTDRNEFYNIPKTDLLSITPPLPTPPLLSDSRPLLKSFTVAAHAISTIVLSRLSTHLGLTDPPLQDLHRIDTESGDQVRFLRSPPQPQDDARIALGAHTDFGSVTVLFNRLGGLQVKLPKGIDPITPPSSRLRSSNDGTAMNGFKRGLGGDDGSDRWAYVRPLPGHAIINLGDALTKFTCGILRSNVHRVAPPPGAQATETKYSVVYFARPEDDVILRPMVRRDDRMLDGAGEPQEGRGKDEWGLGEDQEAPITAKEWILRRALARKVGVGQQGSAGGKEVERDASGFPIGLGDTRR